MPLPRLSLTVLAFNILVLVFAVSAVLGTRPGYDPALSYGPMLAILFSAGVYFIVSYLARPRLSSRLIAAAAVVVGLGAAAYFITQFRYYPYPETSGLLRTLGGITSFLPNLNLGFVHPNGVAAFLEGILPISLSLLISSRHPQRRWLWLGATLVMFYAILLTASRGAWVGLAVAALIWGVVLWMLNLSRPKALVLLGTITVIVGLSVVSLMILISRNPPPDSTLGTAVSRLELYRNSLFLIRDYAFTGIGLGDTFAMVYSRYGLLIFVPFLTYSHNLPLAVWFGQGLLGILSFIGMVVLFYIFVYRVMRRARAGALFYGAWVGVTATLIHGLADARQYTESPWVMPALFFGFALTIASGIRAVWRLEEEETAKGIRPPPRSWRRSIVMAGTAILVIAGGLFLARNTLEALWYTNLGAIDETRADSFIAPNLDESTRQALETSADAWYQKALAVSPALSGTNRRLGNLWVSQGRYEEALPLLEKAYKAEASNPAAIKGLGLAYLWVGRLEDAATMLSLLADQSDIQDELGAWRQYRTDQKQPLLAAYALETLLLLSGERIPNLNVWLLLADDYRAGGNTDKAREWYGKVLREAPNDQRALDGLAAVGG